jgi:hypothetical protein
MEGHLVVYQSVRNKQERIRRLMRVVASDKNKNLAKVVWVTICMLVEALYVSLIQMLNKSVKRIDGNTFEVSYVVSGKLYRMIVKPKRGPSPVIQISNENQEDVTDQVLPFMGPTYNWHGNTTFSPNFFNYQSLIFEFADGSEKVFHQKAHTKLD